MNREKRLVIDGILTDFFNSLVDYLLVKLEQLEMSNNNDGKQKKVKFINKKFKSLFNNYQ